MSPTHLVTYSGLLVIMTQLYASSMLLASK